MTPAFALERQGVRCIIHAVGPIWGRQSDEESDRLLEAAYSNTMRLAESHGVNSVAVPAISNGIYGYPVDRAAKVVAELFRTQGFSVGEVFLMALEPEKTQIYQNALDSF